MLHQPFYDPNKTYQENFKRGPFGAFSDGEVFEDFRSSDNKFFGFEVNSLFGIPSGPLLNSNYVKAAFDKGFDICVYKTVRSKQYPCQAWPNVLAVKVDGDLTLEKARGQLIADKDYREPLSITNSFGVPSVDPEFWQEDITRTVAYARPGQIVIGSFQGTKTGDGDIRAYINDFILTARLLKQAGVKVLEVNLSCPNEGTAGLLCFDIERTRSVVEAIKNEIGNTPLIVKIAYFQDNDLLKNFVWQIGRIADGISAINTIPAAVVDQNGNQALHGQGRLRSGVCGQAIKWAGLEMVSKLKSLRDQLNLSYTIIGVGGISSIEDYMKYREGGADVAMSATSAIWNPYLAQEIKREDNQKKGIKIMNNDLQKGIAQTLLKIKAVGFSVDKPITFTAGYKSPIYVDNRKFPFFPEEWQKVIEGFVKIIKEKNIQFDVIAGIEAGGIPHSASLGYLMRKPSVFVRKKAKEHGIGKRVAGGDVKGKKVLLIEDLVTTGGSAIRGIEALREEGAEVTDCLIIFDYGFKEGQKAFSDIRVWLHSLVSASDALNEAVAQGIVGESEEKAVNNFLNDPHSWMDMGPYTQIPKPSIIDKYNQRVDKVNSLVCVGLDSDFEKLPERFKNMKYPQFEFNKAIIEETHEYAAAYKLNMSMYEDRGVKGLSELDMTMKFIRDNHPNIFTIGDAKRGDIGPYNKGYVSNILGSLNFDAMTLHPYLGRESLEPFLKRRDKGCIIICRTSNPGAGEIQDLESNGKPIWQIVAEKVKNEWNKNNNCLLVVAATYPEEAAAIRGVVGDMTFLMPGIGAQSGDVEAAVKAGINSQGKGLIINSSRGIIFSENPREETIKLRDEINKYR